VASLRARTKLARVHVLDHARTQRADGIRTHGQLLSQMRLTTPRSSRLGGAPATDDLSPRHRAHDRTPPGRRLSRKRFSALALCCRPGRCSKSSAIWGTPDVPPT
jgi:hypothetical protein